MVEARLGGSESEEHHKALKMLKLTSLRQLQREVSGIWFMKRALAACTPSLSGNNVWVTESGHDSKSRAPLLHHSRGSGVHRGGVRVRGVCTLRLLVACQNVPGS